MTPFFQASDVTIYQSDALKVLRELPADSVHCCVTSPPYWGLRKYATDSPDEIGLEATPEEHIARLVGVFAEVRRVLRPDGTLWLNYGDVYASNPSSGGPQGPNLTGGEHHKTPQSRYARPPGYKPKDLMLLPARVALALQADGWWLRSDIIWAKPNPMPESCTDRPTSSYEHVFLLTKQSRYFYDAEAIRERMKCSADSTPEDLARAFSGRREASPEKRQGAIKVPDGWDTGSGSHGREKRRGHKREHQGFRDDWDSRSEAEQQANSRNCRNVWTIPTSPFPGGHFATFSPTLVERCLLAGTSERGVCPECGAPSERVVEKGEIVLQSRENHDPNRRRSGFDSVREKGQPNSVQGSKYSKKGGFCELPHTISANTTIGWCPTCKCGHADAAPPVVLDPFAGSGTVGVVARKRQCRSVLIELSPAYCAIAVKRLAQKVLDFGK